MTITTTNVAPIPEDSPALAKNVPEEQKPSIDQLFAVLDASVPDYVFTGTVYGHPTRRPGTCASCCEDTITLHGTPREQFAQYDEYCQNPVADEYHGGRGYPRRSIASFNKESVIWAALKWVYPQNPMLYSAANDIFCKNRKGIFFKHLLEGGYIKE